MAPRRPWYPALRIAAGVLAAWLLTHALIQGIGAATFWQPCFELGYGSDACAFLQYEAPSPRWVDLMIVWLAEAPVSIAVFALALAAHARVALSLGALLAVVMSNMITDYVVTPALNGGYTSADNAPGFGLFGAALLLIAAAQLAVVALVPTRTRDAGIGATAPVQTA